MKYTVMMYGGAEIDFPSRDKAAEYLRARIAEGQNIEMWDVYIDEGGGNGAQVPAENFLFVEAYRK